jgi:hypothetical protein
MRPPPCWCARAAGTWRSGTCASTDARISASPGRLRPVLLPQRAASCWRAAPGPTSTCPKLESHLEARLWNDVFLFAQDALGIPRGTIRATVLIETILAAFEMDEILYELREHSERPQRRAVGLHLQHHQEVPAPAGLRAARPRPGHDDRPLHARLHAASGQDLPPPRRPRHRRHGRLHPQPPRPAGQPRWPWPRCARTRSASPATASTAPGWRTPTWCPWRWRSSTGAGRAPEPGGAPT